MNADSSPNHNKILSGTCRRSAVAYIGDVDGGVKGDKRQDASKAWNVRTDVCTTLGKA